jgi:signal transduction histidine kinase
MILWWGPELTLLYNDAYALSAWVADGELRVTVADAGRWRPPQHRPESFRGHGLRLMRGLMAEVTVDTTAAGTTVHMRAGLGDG